MIYKRENSIIDVEKGPRPEIRLLTLPTPIPNEEKKLI